MRREVERRAREDADVAAFFLTAGALSGAEMGAALAAALPRMLRILAKYRRPIIATISRSGTVEVKLGERRGGPKT